MSIPHRLSIESTQNVNIMRAHICTACATQLTAAALWGRVRKSKQTSGGALDSQLLS
jgi:hypothetical protein